MKKYLFLSLIVILSSCYSTKLIMVPFEYQNFELNKPLSVTTGSVMIEIESGQHAIAEDKSKELTSIQKSFQSSSKRGFAQELIYQGKVGNIINLTYREYSIDAGGKYIRDNYTEKLQYDLTDSNIIAFRSIKMEIIESTSSLIKYKVIEWNYE